MHESSGNIDWLENKLSKLSIRQLQTFVAATECPTSYDLAGERLGMEGNSVSKAIRRLERDLEHELFQKDMGHHRELTDYGQRLYDWAKDAIENAELVVGYPEFEAAGRTGLLRLAYAGSVLFSGDVTKVIHLYHERYQDVEITMEEYTSADQVVKLKRNEIDIAFLRAPHTLDRNLLYWRAGVETLKAAIPRGHELYGQEQIEIGALAKSDWVMVPRKVSPGFHDDIVRLCEFGFFDPNTRVRQYAAYNLTVLALVSVGTGVAVVPSGVEKIKLDGVWYADIIPEWTTENYLARRKNEPRKVVHDFIEMAEKEWKGLHPIEAKYRLEP